MKLSIAMMAYNQGDFIDEAIRSVINQNLTFSWELLIGDDASTDYTPVIVYGWLQQYPANIFYFRHEKNIGLHKNYQYLIEKSQGEYVALLEADDYWLDPDKSRLQVALMDEHPEIAYSFTNADTVDVNGTVLEKKTFDLPRIFDFNYFVYHFFMAPNNTVVFRKTAEPQVYPDWFFSLRQWDMALQYLRSLNGKIGFLPIKGLAWRRHEGATSVTREFSGPERYKEWLTLNREVGKLVPKNVKKIFKQDFVAYSYIAIAYLKEKKYLQFARYALLMVINQQSKINNKPFKPLKFYRDFFWKVRNIKRISD